MQSRIDARISALVVWWLLGCASSAEAHAPPQTPASAAATASGSTTAAASAAPAPTTMTTSAIVPSGADTVPPKPQPDPKTGQVPRSLPELRVSLSGLHIGGGPNDAVTKRPFIESLERAFDALRVCYREVDEPEKGGTFGVDLRIERAGGHPTLKAVRTVMKGDQFKSCVEQAFVGLEFGRPPKGPTVISASVRFSLES